MSATNIAHQQRDQSVWRYSKLSDDLEEVKGEEQEIAEKLTHLDEFLLIDLGLSPEAADVFIFMLQPLIQLHIQKMVIESFTDAELDEFNKMVKENLWNEEEAWEILSNGFEEKNGVSLSGEVTHYMDVLGLKMKHQKKRFAMKLGSLKDVNSFEDLEKAGDRIDSETWDEIIKYIEMI